MKQPNLSAGAANTHQAALFFPGDLWKGRTSHTTDTPPSYSCEIGSVDITVPAGSVHIGFLRCRLPPNKTSMEEKELFRGYDQRRAI
jgi:hypothetical protein